MTPSESRILTTHVGSLIRPPELQAYYKTMEQALGGGPAVDAAAFEACATQSVADVVQRQAATGIDLVSDGEFGKGWLWASYTIDRLSGLEHRELEPGEAPFSPIHGKDRCDFAEFYADHDQTRIFFGREHEIPPPFTEQGEEKLRQERTRRARIPNRVRAAELAFPGESAGRIRPTAKAPPRGVG